ncbi:hypothetical protein EfmJHP36_19090 [Enterococcus faecium]|nr:hypothetical protein EfmJHP36_19090 [Enterococcus faecium]
METAVNQVGVDVNTASPQLLQHISGLGVYIGIGIDSDGRRTILGFDVQDGESEDNWDTVFQSFVQRGLFGVKLVIILDNTGIHPESYSIAKEILTSVQLSEKELGTEEAVEKLTRLL